MGTVAASELPNVTSSSFARSTAISAICADVSRGLAQTMPAPAASREAFVMIALVVEGEAQLDDAEEQRQQERQQGCKFDRSDSALRTDASHV